MGLTFHANHLLRDSLQEILSGNKKKNTCTFKLLII